MKNIEDILDNNEILVWQGKPSALCYIFFKKNMLVLTGFTIFFIGYIGMFTSYSFANLFSLPTKITANSYTFGIALPYIFLGLLFIVKNFLEYKNLGYAYTDRRIIIRKGIIGIDYITVDYTRAKEFKISVNVIEKILGLGTVIFDEDIVVVRDFDGDTERVNLNKGADRFVNIKYPFEILKSLKTVAFDIKADIYYPNNLRPETNRGYKGGNL